MATVKLTTPCHSCDETLSLLLDKIRSKMHIHINRIYEQNGVSGIDISLLRQEEAARTEGFNYETNKGESLDHGHVSLIDNSNKTEELNDVVPIQSNVEKEHKLDAEDHLHCQIVNIATCTVDDFDNVTPDRIEKEFEFEFENKSPSKETNESVKFVYVEAEIPDGVDLHDDSDSNHDEMEDTEREHAEMDEDDVLIVKVETPQQVQSNRSSKDASEGEWRPIGVPNTEIDNLNRVLRTSLQGENNSQGDTVDRQAVVPNIEMNTLTKDLRIVVQHKDECFVSDKLTVSTAGCIGENRSTLSEQTGSGSCQSVSKDNPVLSACSCETCGRKFTDQNTLSIHAIETAHQINMPELFQYHFRDPNFTTKTKQEKAKKQNVKKKAKSAKKFSDQNTLSMHAIETAHKTNIPELSQYLSQDPNLTTGTGQENSKKRKRKKNGKSHEKNPQSENEKKTTRSQDTQLNAETQVSTYMYAQVKPFECDICKKQFRMKGTLTTHYRLHTGEKPYHCTQCDERFRQLNGLQNHMRKYHRSGPGKPT